MTELLLLLKYAGSISAIAALALAGFAVGRRPRAGLMKLYRRYTEDLDRRMRLLFLPARGVRVSLLQLSAAFAVVLAYIGLGKPSLLLLIAVIAVLPRAVLARMAHKRVLRIEQKLDGFVLALANALRATPSIGAALASVLPVAPPPIDEELGLVLREMRVGSTLEQALLALGGRVESMHLDAVLSSLLIGRKVGGNVPEILDETANALREMTRLSGVLRAKTAEGRVQANVLALFPLFLLFAFDALSPGYFDPLLHSAAGIAVITIASTCWLSSVVVARRIMAVSL
jgi:tight adherence protein B